MKQSVSPMTAVVVILLAVLASAVIFSRPEWVPAGAGTHSHGEEEAALVPPEPEISDQEVQGAREGLKEFGVLTVLPPLPEDRRQGARVAWVTPGSPAAEAGIQPGDRVEEFNGEPVAHPLMLVGALMWVEEGKPSTVVVSRGNERLTLTVTGLTPATPEERMRRRR